MNQRVLRQIIGLSELDHHRGEWLPATIAWEKVQRGHLWFDRIRLNNAAGTSAFELTMTAAHSNRTTVDAQPILRQCFLVQENEVCTAAAEHEIALGIATTTPGTAPHPQQILMLYNMEPREPQHGLPRFERPSFLSFEWVDAQGERHLLARTVKSGSCWGQRPGGDCEPPR